MTFDCWVSKRLLLAFLVFEALLLCLQQDLLHYQHLAAVVAVVVTGQDSSWGPFEDSVVPDSSWHPLPVTVELAFLPAEVMIESVEGSFLQMAAGSWMDYLPVDTSENLVAA